MAMDQSAAKPLPLPESDELKAVTRSAAARAAYAILYERRGNPPNRAEIDDYIEAQLGRRSPQDQRRARELYEVFQVDRIPDGVAPRYKLVGWSKVKKLQYPPISRKLRAEVLQFGRCQMCGKTASEDGVKLDVDHKIPQSWGGNNDRENLQALCQECNGGKKNHFASMNQESEKISAAIAYSSPHQRIGELLKAYAEDPNGAPTEILEIVASAGTYQADWQKRMRELKKLGWDYEVIRKYQPGDRVRTSYRLTAWTPWPEEGSIIRAIRAAEKSQAAAKKPAEDS